MKKFLSLILILALIIGSPLSSFAEVEASQKEEVVYGILGLDGSVEEVYVVNIFKDNNIVDYGNYSNLKNMTSSDKIIQEKDKIKIDTQVDRLYYEGTLEDKQLPWNIKINYILDGTPIKGEELSGESGALEINIFVEKNTKINSTFFDNYALQIGLTLDTKLADNIKSTNATVAEAGSKKQLTYTVLPEVIDVSVKADVKNFETDPITINGIKMNLGMSIDNEAFTGQISQLTDAIDKLDNGAQGLLNGAKSLENGIDKYVKGLKEFKDGLKQLTVGVDGVDKGAQALSQGLLELEKQKESLISGANSIQNATFVGVNENLSKMNLELPVLTPENYKEVLKNIPELVPVMGQLDGVVQFTNGLQAYTGGVGELSKGASKLSKGTNTLNSSVSSIPKAANSLYNGAVELNSGMKNLRSGLAEYKNGTNKLKNSTSNIDSQINNSIDEIVNGITGNGDPIVSFVSEKNTDVLAVQFVIKTQEIKLPKIEVEKKENIELTFFEKILNLFGIKK